MTLGNSPQIEPEDEFLNLILESKANYGSESEICVGF